MSEENVEIVRRGLEGLDRRDRSAWLALSDEDLEVVPSRDWPESGVRGPEAAFDWYLQAFDSLQPFPTTDTTEFIDAGADKVLLQYRMDLRGKASGAKVEWRRWCVVTMRKGRGLRHEWFTDRADALEAAGGRSSALDEKQYSAERYCVGDVGGERRDRREGDCRSR